MSHTGMECVHSEGLKLLHPGHIEDTIHSYTSQWVPFQAISHGIQIALLPPSTHRKPMAATQCGPLKHPIQLTIHAHSLMCGEILPDTASVSINQAS